VRCLKKTRSSMKGSTFPLSCVDVAGNNSYGFMDLKTGTEVAFFRESCVYVSQKVGSKTF